MPTTHAILHSWRLQLRAVPHAGHPGVCNRCLGPVHLSHQNCTGCHKVFSAPGVPAALRAAVVPMTAALKPSSWYFALISYKNYRPDLRALIASVAHHFIQSRRHHLTNLLGGEPTLLTVVPSKRGVPYEKQPLQAAMAAIQSTARLLTRTLVYDPEESIPHLGFNAAAFRVGPIPVRDERILLIEDTWVTGATSVSAAAALLDHGAASVAILPIARVVSEDYWPAEHPYRIAMAEPFEPDRDDWPR